MKFSVEVIINKPINEVVECFENPDYLKDWQDGFVSYEHVDGEPGKSGSKTKLVYNMRGREMEMMETIKVNKIPDQFSAVYEHEHMTNEMSTRFIALDEQTTQMISELNYSHFRKTLIRWMAKLLPGSFKKPTQKWLNQFKDFVENRSNT